MAFIPATDVAKVELKQTQFGQELLNVLWFKLGTSITQALLDAVVANVKTAWQARIKPQISSSLTLHEIVGTDQSVSNGVSSVDSFTPIAGTGTVGNPLPANCSVVITTLTGHRGRSFRGRIYQTGIGDGVQGADPNQITTAYAGTLVGVWLDFINDMQAGTPAATMSVVSHFANKAPRASAAVNEILAVSVNVFLDSQRRRLTGRGK